jgi:glycerol-3-phosphate O-acyltransferase/dihydroxyacetone phosphate acyltransferase
MIWHALRTAWRLGLAAFFRRIEVTGKENLPPEGPLLLVPNHTNAFVDAFLIAAVVPRRVTLTAKSTLFRQPFLRILLWAADAVALHRQQDRGEGADPAANLEAIAECRRRLSRGAAICIFPEGVSHSDGHLRPLRTGAARIALDYADHKSDSLTIVPVGLHYEAKEKFRSAVWVRFGAPIDAAAWRRAHPDAGPRELSAEIDQRLRALTLNFRRRREALLLQWTAEVLATRGLPPPVLGKQETAVTERAILAGLLIEGYERLEVSHRSEISELEERVVRYHAELRRLGISPSEVYLEMDVGRAALFVVRELEMLVMGLPLALLGTVLHGPASALTRAIVRRISADRDHRATNAVGLGSILILVSATIELCAAWILLTWPFALALTALLPYSGYYALLYRDRAGGIFRRGRTFLTFLFDRGLQRRLSEEGRAIIAGIERLAEAIPA